MKNIYFIGIDSSTTATKSILIDQEGKIKGVEASEYSYETPHPLWSEQHPHLWWQATVESIRKVIAATKIDPKDVKGIGLTGQMHGLVILDKKGQVLRPAILWNDQRTQKQCENIRETIGRSFFIRITGNDALSGFTAPKILWVKDEEPEIYKQIEHILLPKDYVRYKLTNQFAVDRAGGSGTVLFNLAERDWSSKLIEDLGMKLDWFPPTFEGTEITSRLTKAAAVETGLQEGTPIFGGGGDQAAAAVGTGAVIEGILSLSLGTSGVVFAPSNAPFIEPNGRLHAFCHAIPKRWHLMGVMLSAAGSLRWLRDTFREKVSFEELVQSAKDVPAGSEGLFYMPYLTGERTPHPDPLARAGFIGMTVRHSMPHFVKSVLEGVAFGLRDSFELIKHAGIEDINQVRITGGGAKNPFWRQIIADVLNTSISSVDSKEGAAYGAALLAATGEGIYASVEEACQNAIHLVDETTPSDNNSTYKDLYEIYRGLYPALKQTFHQIPSDN